MIKRNRSLLVIMALYLALAAAFNVTVGIGEAPDEPPHMEYARFIAERHALPVAVRPPAPQASNEAYQPPAYYVLGAVLTGWIARGDFQLVRNPAADITPGRVWGRQTFFHTDAEAFPYHGLVLAYRLMRGVTTILGAITLWAIYRTAHILRPRDPTLAALAAGLAAFNPQFLFITASVNNDTMAMAAASLVLLNGLAAWQRPSLGLTLSMGVLIGLAALSKYSALAVVPGAALALATPYLRKRQWRLLAGHAALLIIIPVLLSGWWYVRNVQLYGDPLAQRIALHILASVRRYSPWTLDELPNNIYNMFTSSWGRFGWTQINLHAGFYIALAVMCIAALFGVLLAAWRTVRARRGRRWEMIPYASLALGGVGVVAAIWYYHLSVLANQGRLFFPGIVAFAIYLALGLTELAGRWKTWLSYGLTAGLIALSIGSLVFVIGPTYSLPHILSETELHPSHPLTAQFGESIALRGFDISPRALRPGQSFKVTFYWQAKQRINASYQLLIHVLDPSGRPIAHSTTRLFLGRYDTRLWRPGDLFADEYGLKLVPDAQPGAAALSIVLDTTDPAPPAEWTVDSQSVGERLTLVTLKILPQSSPVYRPTRPLSVRLGDSARLVGYDLSTPSVRAGETLTATLYWQVIQPIQQDVHVFMHLLCPDQKLIAQDDNVPGQGWYPSAIWAAGDMIRDVHTLNVDADAAPSVCALSAGLYDFGTHDRLPAVDASGQRVTDDRVMLAAVEIVP